MKTADAKIECNGRLVIVCKYLPATATLGARMKASAPATDLKPVTIPWDYAGFGSENAELAVAAFLERHNLLGEPNEWVGAYSHASWTFVNIAGRSHLSAPSKKGGK